MKKYRLDKWATGLREIGFLFLVLLCGSFQRSYAQDTVGMVYHASDVDEVNMIKGELVTIEVEAMTRVSISDPMVADIADAQENEVLVVGKGVGQAALFIWDQYGKRTVMIYVFEHDLDLTKKRIEKLLMTADVFEVKLAASPQEGKVVLSGDIPVRKRDIFDKVVEPFTPQIINLVKDENIEDLVQIDLQISELNTLEAEALGIDWFTGDQTIEGATGVDAFEPAYTEIYPDDMEPGIKDFFKVGKFQRTMNSTFVAKINALSQQGKARILAKPKLVVISGKEAQFLVGGEIPIRTTTVSDSGASQENVEFKEYGISMTITPKIHKDTKVDVIMNLEVSEVDAATASAVSEDVAFLTRSASTHLLLDDNETIIMAGLIKHTENVVRSKVPFMGNIPVVGALFRSKKNPVPNVDQELVIALTPHILAQKDAGEEEEMVSRSGKGKGGEASAGNATSQYVGIPKEMIGYVQGVQEKIFQSVVYPPEARDSGWEGTVKMKLLILKDGTLAFVLVKDSSGHEIFDEAALRTTKIAAPFPAFPSNTDLQELSLTIPIVYSLKRK